MFRKAFMIQAITYCLALPVLYCIRNAKQTYFNTIYEGMLVYQSW